MNGQKISFCNTNGYFIKNLRNKSVILYEITKTYNFPLKSFDKSYSDNLLNFIMSSDTLACFITSGTKYYLYLTQFYNENYSIFIKSDYTNIDDLTIISVPFNFSDDLYTGTLFQGELLLHSNKWFFLVEKTIIYKGKNICDMNHIDNIKLSHSIINSYVPMLYDPMQIKMKKFMLISDIENQISMCKYKLNGIKFLCLKNPIQFLFNVHNYSRSPIINLDLLPSNKQMIDLFKDNRNKLVLSFNNTEHNPISNIDDPDKIQQFKVINTSTKLVYSLVNNKNEDKGILRIVRFEDAHLLSDLLSKISSISINVKYNPDFGKYEFISF